MGKRSDFKRKARDYYKTPMEAVLPLLPHLKKGTKFAEMMAGDGQLARNLEAHGHKCVWASDIKPMGKGIKKRDFFKMDGWTNKEVPKRDCMITNPPWDRDILHPAILKMTDFGETWLLLDADWMHTIQAAPYMSYCDMIVAVGRVKWIKGSKNTGKDNCCWYRFQDMPSGKPPVFIPRARKPQPKACTSPTSRNPSK